MRARIFQALLAPVVSRSVGGRCWAEHLPNQGHKPSSEHRGRGSADLRRAGRAESSVTELTPPRSGTSWSATSSCAARPILPPFDVTQPYVTESTRGVRLPTYIDWDARVSDISVTGHPAISVPGGFSPPRVSRRFFRSSGGTGRVGRFLQLATRSTGDGCGASPPARWSHEGSSANGRRGAEKPGVILLRERALRDLFARGEDITAGRLIRRAQAPARVKVDRLRSVPRPRAPWAVPPGLHRQYGLHRPQLHAHAREVCVRRPDEPTLFTGQQLGESPGVRLDRSPSRCASSSTTRSIWPRSNRAANARNVREPTR